MKHYKYTIKEEDDLKLLKKKANIIKEEDDFVIYSLSNLQVKSIKDESVKGDLDYIKMKRITFESEILHSSEILDLLLDNTKD